MLLLLLSFVCFAPREYILRFQRRFLSSGDLTEQSSRMRADHVCWYRGRKSFVLLCWKWEHMAWWLAIADSRLYLALFHSFSVSVQIHQIRCFPRRLTCAHVGWCRLLGKPIELAGVSGQTGDHRWPGTPKIFKVANRVGWHQVTMINRRLCKQSMPVTQPCVDKLIAAEIGFRSNAHHGSTYVLLNIIYVCMHGCMHVM